MKKQWKRVFCAALAVPVAASVCAGALPGNAETAQAAGKLIASFSFDDEQTGLSGSGAVAKAVDGTVKFSDDVVEGNGRSLEMDGSYYLDVTDEAGKSLLAGCTELTISYLSKSQSDGFWSYYAQNTSSTTFQRDYIGVLDKGASVTAERGDGKGNSPARTVSASGDGWKLVTVVYTAKTTTLYVNDKSSSFEVNDFDLVNMMGDNNRLTIGAGAWNNYGERLKGYIDDFRIYDYAMSDGEVKQMYLEKLSAENLKQELQQKYVPLLDLTGLFADGAVMKSQQIELPDKVEYQGTKASVTWTSSDNSIVNPNGVVTCPDQDTSVTLTAAVTIGSQTVTKEFTIPVYARSGQKKQFQENFIIPSYAAAGDALPVSYGAGTVAYSGSSLILPDGTVSDPGTKTAETKVTAEFTLDGDTATKTFTVHVLPETAGKFLCYTRETGEYQFYPENLSYSMHLASADGDGTYKALNNNTGVLFAAGYYKNDENMSMKALDRPYLFYMKDGSYAVIAQYMDLGQAPTSPILNYDSDHKGMAAVYTTDDLLHYSEEHFIRLSSDAWVKDAVCEYDTANDRYVIRWEDTNGKFYRTTMRDILDDSSIIETVPGPILSVESGKTEIDGALNRNILPVEKSVGVHVNEKLNKLVNTRIKLPRKITASSPEDIENTKVTAVYSDESTDEKEVVWDYSKVDFSKKGETYTITGKVDSGNNYGFGAALNQNGKVQTVDPNGGDISGGLTDSAQNWADPDICYWHGKYYFVSTNDWNGNIGIFIRKADTIEGLFEDGVKAYEIVSYNDALGHTAQFWAPELHEVNGKLCMFFAINFYSRVVVLEGSDPTKKSDWGEIHDVVYADGLKEEGDNGQYLHRRSMAIDMTYFESGDKSYVVWSGREPVNGWGKGAFLYIATCDREKPWIITSKAKVLNGAVFGWEQVHGVVAEGPFVVKHDGKIYLTYSGASVDNTYAVGLMTAGDGKDLLDLGNWTRSNYPLLNSSSVEGEFGPGHSCFFTKENGDILFIYHGRGPQWNSPRTVGVRRMQFDADGEPYLAMTDGEDVLEEFRTVTMKVTVKDESQDGKLPYEDVGDDWYTDFVKYTYENDLMTGLQNGKIFDLRGTLSRAQFATILYRMAGGDSETGNLKPEGAVKNFTDVDYEDTDLFYRYAVEWASSEKVGIITGYTDEERKGSFGPADQITREQMATMMYRFAGYLKIPVWQGADLSAFPDGDDVSPFAAAAMEWAVRFGLFEGNDTDHTLAPQGNTERSACAKVITIFDKTFLR